MIPTVEQRDGGSYYCEADNQLGQPGKDRLNLIVLHKPKVTTTITPPAMAIVITTITTTVTIMIK